MLFVREFFEKTTAQQTADDVGTCSLLYFLFSLRLPAAILKQH